MNKVPELHTGMKCTYSIYWVGRSSGKHGMPLMSEALCPQAGWGDANSNQMWSLPRGDHCEACLWLLVRVSPALELEVRKQKGLFSYPGHEQPSQKETQAPPPPTTPPAQGFRSKWNGNTRQALGTISKTAKHASVFGFA